jgi:NAD-dependent deacetylase
MSDLRCAPEVRRDGSPRRSHRFPECDDAVVDPSNTVVPAAAAAEVVARAHRITVLTGAGVSTDSGIPDFRGPNGLWRRDPAAERASHLDAYLADGKLRVRAWRQRLEHAAWVAEPNAAHVALAAFERSGRLELLVTQNVDGLHQRAGSDPAVVCEVHGTIHRAMCWSCGERFAMSAVLERVAAGEDDPDCASCGGILKSDTISFGQQLDAATIDRAFLASVSCDLLIAAGTTLAVQPVAQMVPRARRAGAAVIIVNGDETELDHLATAIVRGSISALLPVVLGVHDDDAM